jgi:hypothetical protein
LESYDGTNGGGFRGGVQKKELWSEKWLRFAQRHRSTKALREGGDTIGSGSPGSENIEAVEKSALSK